jgi:hypothetical protein
MAKLKTTGDVLDYLGGDKAVAAMLDTTPKAVSNWRYFNVFPAHSYLVIKRELRDRGKKPPDELWAMTPLKRQPD